ncbi:MAG: type IV pilus modification protein PilV [Gammaproteobacteria bacterium]|nr:type IV pilus modification protein PilV [Gammaproteobacteria bacterium]
MLSVNNRQKGVSLIESMIALVVISVGLLGIAALQVTSMKQSNSALHHSQAVWIGFNIAERIRSNFGQFANYDGIDTNTGYSQDCIAAACSPADLITSDAADWADEVKNLPSGRGVIDAPFGNQLRIQVMWDDGDPGAGCENIIDAKLTCYTVILEQ